VLAQFCGRLDIAIGVTRMPISSQQDGQVGRDRVAADTLQRWPELGAQGRTISTVT
jgi:hypothetical protein